MEATQLEHHVYNAIRRLIYAPTNALGVTTVATTLGLHGTGNVLDALEEGAVGPSRHLFHAGAVLLRLAELLLELLLLCKVRVLLEDRLVVQILVRSLRLAQPGLQGLVVVHHAPNEVEVLVSRGGYGAEFLLLRLDLLLQLPVV